MYRVVLGVVALCCVSSAAIAQDQNNDQTKDVRSLFCAKKPSALPSGEKHGELSGVKVTIVYSGPSAVCKYLGFLNTPDQFRVIGQARSRFGNHWYQVSTEHDFGIGWVPSKYVALREPSREVIAQPPEPVKLSISVRN